MAKRDSGLPGVVVEVLRLCVVVFFAGVGFSMSQVLGSSSHVRVGPVDTSGVGILSTLR